MVNKIEMESLLLLLTLTHSVDICQTNSRTNSDISKFKVRWKTRRLGMPVHLVASCVLQWKKKKVIIALCCETTPSCPPGITIWMSSIGVIISLVFRACIIHYYYTVCLFLYCIHVVLPNREETNKQIQFEQDVYQGAWVLHLTMFTPLILYTITCYMRNWITSMDSIVSV